MEELGSQIIVITDAPSKNTDIEQQVITRAKDFKVCIHFFLSEVGVSVESYSLIARETGGSIITNAWEFTNFIASYRDCRAPAPESSPAKRSASVDLHCQSFRVSRFTNILRLSVRPSVTGLRMVTIRKPSGNTATPQVIDSSTGNRFAAFTERHPEFGVWSVCVERGTVEVYTSPKVILDVVILYPKNESHLSGAVLAASNTPPACKVLKMHLLETINYSIPVCIVFYTGTEGRIAVLTSRSAEMLSAYLNIIGNGQVVARVP